MSTTFTATVEHVNHTTSRATVRTHSFLVDRGLAKGGLDQGPAGGEYMLVSLGGCFTSHLLAAIRARSAPMTGVKVAVRGTLDGVPERFTTFSLDVTAECPDVDLAHRLVTVAARSCQVINTLRHVSAISLSYEGSRVPWDEMASAVV